MFQFCVIYSVVLVTITFAQTPIDPINRKLNTTGILEKHNYAQQVHEVLTEDGYLLTINRILSKNTSDPNPKVVFLNHGFLQSAYYWLIRGPPDALGFVLADAGYDVWLINNRGNGDSMTAVHPPATDDFWNFGLDEIGLYDTPAAIDYILDETNQTDLTFVCHSQGCTMYYIMCLEKPEYEVKINKLIGLAPFFGMKYPASVFNIGPFINLASTIGFRSFDIGTAFKHALWGFCIKLSIRYCRDIFFSVNGRAPAEMPFEIFRLLKLRFPGSASSKNYLQVSQWIRRNNIFKYNYGPTKNLQIYGTTSPPIYNLTFLEHSPKYLFYGDLDYTVSPRSFEHSLKQLSNVHQVIRIDGYAHCEFTFGWSVYSKVNTKILSILQDKN